ncbi:hypothetical protein GDO81_006402 [Engystomops pustulosus]|uniref:Helicase C-terminal domain-containing protein n=1 Tax=Engystomops pustulosus TaxID=76066 RepID=A0AAV7CXL1_ENGPU|nr:hypothetical protein GDO81_006402 [Engystomops pustulosus]
MLICIIYPSIISGILQTSFFYFDRAQHLSEVLTAKGFPAVCISGSMNQNQRLEAMAKLKQYHCRVLISTDLTARGIDADKVNLVINLDVPHDWETYMHRIGRAGRFGTYGLSVSYCCRGEEENLMMSISQKCNLRLLPLPEPIPDGLMEEACDWNIEVLSVKNSSQAVMSEVKADDSFTMQSMDMTTLPDLSTHRKTKTTQPKQKKITKKKSTEKENPQEWMQGESSGLSKKLSDTSKPRKTLEGLENEKKIKHGLDNSLPKIPSLSSFKRPVVCTSSFAELVEDYEQFIKEGLEKHVEVIRVYSDTGSRAERLSSENLENSSIDMPSDTAHTPEQYNPSVNSSDDRYSSSSSLSESEDSSEESTHSLEELKTKEQSSSCPDLSAERTDGAAYCPLNVDDVPMASEDVQQASLVKANCLVAKDKMISNSKKLRKRGKKVTQLSKRELCPESQDDMYQLDYVNTSAFPYGNMSYADYWRSYYQAWQSYHSAVSSSYYRNVYKCSNWMSAYHMHSVYLHEMLKP